MKIINHPIHIGDVAVIKYGVETYDFDKDLLDGLRYRQVISDLILPKNIKRIKNNSFEAFSLHKIVLPDNLISIGDDAFSLCSHLSEINLPESLTSIGSKAFYECSGLTSVNIPENVTIIEDYAFANCSGLTSIYISENVTSIGINVFNNCISIKEIHIKAKAPPTGNGNIPNQHTVKLYIPQGSKEAYQKHQDWNNFSEYIEEK